MREAEFNVSTMKAEKSAKLTAHLESVKITKDAYVAKLAANGGKR